MRASLVISALLLLCFKNLQAQTPGEKCVWIKTYDTWVKVDSLSVLPASARIAGVDSSEYAIEHDLTKGKILVRLSQPADSVELCYQTLGVDLSKQYFNRSLDVYDSNAYFKDPVSPDPLLAQKNELFTTEGLNKSGSISRGISFGNNQDVFVNSTLNLNLDGKLSDDLNIRASITDQNVPFQPEGNTQQLQDFDNVFIQIYNEKLSLTGGDVVLQDRSSHFLKYYKNVQGGVGTLNYSLTGADTASTSIGVSVAKGRFASVQIPPKEGLLGPYQIPGPDGERFVIVLANSERVFLDGQQLERGFNNDYIIDYNTAQLTFTNKVLITQFSRIRVDYEFSDQDYNRTILTGKHTHQVGKFNFGVSAYSEKDNRNRPLLVELSDADKRLLSEVGDSLNLAIKSGADSVGFSVEQVLYRSVDTVSSGETFTIFEYSTDPEEAVYRVTFSDVGIGNGNYEQAMTTANGRVYQWVAPVGGEPQGNYEPVIDIPVPDKKQMVTLMGSYQLNKHETVTTEMAFTDQDVNLFSPINDEDDNGYAMKVGLLSEGRKVSFMPKYTYSAFIDYEYDDERFRPIDRFRYIEYDRDWSYNPQPDDQLVSDNIFNVGFNMQKDASNNVGYTFSRRYRENQVEGYQHDLKLNQQLYNFKVSANAFYLENDLTNSRATWSRLFTDVSYQNKYLVPGYQYNVDQNRVENKLSDSITNSAMFFNEHVYYLKNAPQSDWEFLLSHSQRIDQMPVAGDLQDFTDANTTRLNLGKDIGNDRLDVVFTYRNVDQVAVDEQEEVISGRVDWRALMFDNLVRSDLTYAISNSQELKREFVFIKVPAGEGTHTWRDLNEDGVQDLNEFFEAINPDERNYAKIFVPTNEFVTAFQTLFIYNINIQTPRAWRTAEGLKRFLSKFSNNTSWSADTKTTDDDLDTRLLSFAQNVDRANLISERNTLRSTLFFNRANPKYGLELSFFDAERKQLLVNGFESTFNTSYDVNVRYNLSKELTLKLRTVTGNKESASDFLEGRNYLIDSDQINPEIAWQPQGYMR
ncbi:hypothetical protein E1176_09525, partial [Fulvivirga sp. RKSG066]|uniref:hypothetical protein n=1 Tax=Fulvivirga aurantia TaxID=2529383 RepID=UPI0012BD025E